ncbi:hypothetical protein DVH24_042172 [Malus domestica]|uniref:Uncharacterized protein n=1 Tax=Malus domestica TaxID=3750 RepID=A0A498J3R7_MALDO|nr:hypothetical protein DVH24_042172 [Malus domestica]
MVNYASGLMKLVDVEVFGNFGEMVYVVQFGCDECLYYYVYKRWQIKEASCFGHLESVDKFALNGQPVHELLIRRVENSHLVHKEELRRKQPIGCELTYLRACDKPYDLEVKPSNIRLLTKYFPQKFGFVGESSKGKGKGVKCKGKLKAAPKKATKKVLVTCVELERAFKECEDMDDALKMRLIYFAKVVLIRVKSNMGVNLAHLDLVEDMNRFNTYS